MKIRRLLALLAALALLAGNCLGCALAEDAPAGAAIVDLRTQGRVNPVGIDAANPSFSWKMESSAIGAAQAAYQITVRDEAGETVWDSGAVESAASNEILYEGEPLTPSSAYTWSVAVTDQSGAVLQSGEATFETALMSDSFEAWDGAQWIGAGELALDAASKAVFHISADVQLSEGSNAASFVLGASDFRLENAVFNPLKAEGENYVRVELDFSAATPAGGAKINVYRCGYAPGDDPSAPIATVSECEELDSVLNSGNQYEPHHFDIFCTASTFTFTVDGVELVANTVFVNPIEGSSNTYPNLNCVGFAANPGERATFTNYRIENGGKFARGTLLDETTGATYAIFEGIAPLTVDGASITVDGGADGALAYADPSYAAAPCCAPPSRRRTGSPKRGCT